MTQQATGPRGNRRLEHGCSVGLLRAAARDARGASYGSGTTGVGGQSPTPVGPLPTLLRDNLALPFEAEVPGVRVTVERIDLTPAGEIVAYCRRAKHRQAIPVLYLTLPSPPPPGAEWVEAYRHWTPGM